MKIILASWNVRGLNDPNKQEETGNDCTRYNIDLLAVQETKMTTETETDLKSGYKFICLQQKYDSHGGLGYLVKNSFIEYITNYEYVSDRVAILDLQFESPQGETNVRIFNVYGHTLEKSVKDPHLREIFYDQIQNVIDKTPKSWEVIILGDFNSRLGSKEIKNNTREEEEEDIPAIGQYGYGEMNENGECLLNFLLVNEYVALNTTFKHPPKHRTTWTTYIKSSEILKCKSCEFETPHKCQIKEHIKTVHTKIKEIKCHQCGYISSNKAFLKKHLKTVHEKRKNFACDLCAFYSIKMAKLKRHVETNHKKNSKHKCESCSEEKTRPFRAQIDYILGKKTSNLLKYTDCRAYHGSNVESDHAIVIAKIVTCTKPKEKRKRKYNTPKLPMFDVKKLYYDPKLRNDFQLAFSNNIVELNDESKSPNDSMIDLLGALKNAEEIIPQIKGSKQPNDPKLEHLIQEKNTQYKKLKSDESLSDRSTKRKELNLLKKKIRRRIAEIEEEKAENVIKKIESSKDDSYKMFKAVKEIKNSSSKRNIIVTEDNGKAVIGDSKKAEVIRKYFEKQFSDPHIDTNSLKIEKRPLSIPINEHEVKSAIQKLKNNKATGPDNISNELIKCAGPEFVTNYTNIINEAFKGGKNIDCIGEGLLAPNQKPKKPQGPVTNLRPIILLNGTRKILSTVTLRRIDEKVDNYTGEWQCAYKKGNSCSDIVFCQRILSSVVEKKHWNFTKMSTDMTAAFDNIIRNTIINLLYDCGCTEDEVQMVKMLLSETKLRVKIRKSLSEPFLVTLGSFQGDSLSAKLFSLYLAGALNQLRAISGAPNPPINHNLMPLESQYADDADFYDENGKYLKEKLFPLVKSTFKDWNLKVNDTKTEYTTIEIAKEPSEKGSEDWRTTTCLGSKLDSNKDILHRINLGCVAFGKYKKIW